MQEQLKALIKSVTGINDVEIEIPKNASFGDYSTNIAMIAAKKNGTNPSSTASDLVAGLKKDRMSSILDSITSTPQGFINFKLKDSFLQDNIKSVLDKKGKYGRAYIGKGKKVLIEFVSANPTGPLHIGHGRWAVIGDCVARLLLTAGFKVDTEFYVNDAGEQVEKLVSSINARMNGTDIPEGGYAGAYIGEMASVLKDEKDLKKKALDRIISEQRSILDKLGVSFKNWFYESTLHKKGLLKKAVELLTKKGLTFSEGNALWFKSSAYGDDKNRVLIKDDGSATYFAADIAYHIDKFNRGYDRLINVWGTDHHGYIGRLKAALTALGYPAEKLQIIIGQLVALYRGKELVRMSKRTGEMITLKEVIEEIGKDETRYFLVRNSPNTHIDFDLELAKSKSMENPVYYVKYAHARIKSIITEAAKIGLHADGNSEMSLLTTPAERNLMLKLLRFSDEVANSAQQAQPHRLTAYAEELAQIFHNYYHQQRVITDDQRLSKARLALVLAASIVIKNVLNLLGIEAPEQM